MSPRHPPNDLRGDDSSDEEELDEEELDRFLGGRSFVHVTTPSHDFVVYLKKLCLKIHCMSIECNR